MRIVPTAALIVAAGVSLAAQDYFAPVNNPTVELLWPDGAPGALGSEDADKPTITIYLPSEAAGHGHRASSSIRAAATTIWRWTMKAIRWRGG